jgi:hypothetical protein
MIGGGEQITRCDHIFLTLYQPPDLSPRPDPRRADAAQNLLGSTILSITFNDIATHRILVDWISLNDGRPDQRTHRYARRIPKTPSNIRGIPAPPK